MSTKTKVDLVQKFRELLKDTSLIYGEHYHHLFSILTKEELQETLEYLKKEYKSNKKEWFYYFHKSIRQTDFFSGLRSYNIIDKLTPKQRKRRNFLLEKRRKEYNEFKKLHPDENEEAYKKFSSHPKRIETLKELQTLNGILNTKVENSINGHLDMLLWNTIRIDNKNELKFIFEKTFKNA